MTKYILTDFELNGYNDSDFVCSYYDDVANEIAYHEYGSTRFPSPSNISFTNGISSVIVDDEPLLWPTAEIVEKARLVLAKRILARIVMHEANKVIEPQTSDFSVGLRVRLNSDCKMQETIEEDCRKCSGTGKWVNPKNAEDKRDCFSCNGSGKHFAGKAKDVNGKQLYKHLPYGLSGTVVDWKFFGTFYSNGYNKQSRDNTTVQFRTNSGELVRASLSKLRLDREVTDSIELEKQAYNASYSYNFSQFYPHFAWDTTNFAILVAGKQK